METMLAALSELARDFVKGMLGSELPEDGLRLAHQEKSVEKVVASFRSYLWSAVNEQLQERAESDARVCGCGRLRQKDTSAVSVDVIGQKAIFDCPYFFCRKCHVGVSPVRRWLGIHDGSVSMGVDRLVAYTASQMAFGDTVKQLRETHGQDMDRTKAERITYRVGAGAEQYLDQKRAEGRAIAESTSRTRGAEAVIVTADGGGVPVGHLERPDIGEGTALTPVRKLAKGTRNHAKREMRVVIARENGKADDRIVDLRIDPLAKPEITGERMYFAAVHAGCRDNTHVHGVFDMGSWPKTQFDSNFQAHSHSATADISHVVEYLCAAARNLDGAPAPKAWGESRKQELLAGKVDEVLDPLRTHTCSPKCEKDEHGCCLTLVALRYVTNSRPYLNYEEMKKAGLPIGSGEVESAIRHLVRKRLDVAGAWTEANVNRVAALITIRMSGWWLDFFAWLDARDKQAWTERQHSRRTRRTSKRRDHAPDALK